MPVLPASAATNSGRDLWFSMLAGFASESARTFPVGSTIVTRAPADCPSWDAMSASECAGSRAFSTRCASNCAFWVRSRSISTRREASQALPIMTSKIMAAAMMTARKAASSLKNIRFLKAYSPGVPHLECLTWSTSLRTLKPVASAPHSLKVARILRIRFDFLANTADVNVHRTRSDVGSVAPDGVKEMVPRENAAKVPREVVQQSKFGGGGWNGLASHRENHGSRVNRNVADGKWTCGKRSFEAAQYSLDAGYQLTRAERFGNVVIGSEFETEDAISLAALGGKENYRNGRKAGRLADGAAQFESVLAGDHDIEHEKSGALALCVRNYI